MDRNKVIMIAAITICLSAIVKVFHWPGSQFANNVMRIALISGILFLIVDRYKTRNKDADE